MWKSAPAVSRTAAQFTFTLTLSLEHTPTNATAGDEVRWPGSLKFGDGNEVEGGAMKVSIQVICSYIIIYMYMFAVQG